ncbi:thiamine pyrophosphate-binding protein [Defluviimonas sp. SAOS-178_SWC]|uniref:thiamine pyrophosphate-binding protein n=1 Tax=Defluviimonas sp. SAOS-178_SWC TaxID=3121287 RepID=UPI003221946E
MTQDYEGGDLVVESLRALGVKQIFSVSGGPLNSVYRAAARYQLPLIHSRHESAAGFMADATARISRIPGVALVTLGPGVTNMTTPALVAKMAGTPLLIIGAQAPLSVVDRGVAMAADHLSIMQPVVKWAARVPTTQQIPEYLEMAWRHMWSGTPGPVFLEIPTDLLSAPAQPAEPARFTRSRAGMTVEARDGLSELVRKARRPLFILGDELHWDAPNALTSTVERIGAPFVTMRLARGIVDERHALCAGPGYLPLNESLQTTLDEADLIMMIGHHFEFDIGFGCTVGPQAKVVQFSSDAAMLHRNRNADLAAVAGASAVIEALAGAECPGLDRDWVALRTDAWRDERKAQADDNDSSGSLHPVAAIDAVVEGAPLDAVFVTSHGNIDFWADGRIRVMASDLYLRAGQGGALGAEVCFGIGARFANPGRPAIVFVGDGGVGYHVTEIDTAARYDRPVIIVVLDDQKWSAIALPQKMRYGDEFEMELPRRDWPAVAKVLGGTGYFAATVEEIRTAISDAIASGKPAIVHIPVKSALSPYMAAVSK